MLEETLQTLRGRIHTPPADFPHAPMDWTPDNARMTAQREGLTLTEAHWELVRALQEYFARNEENTLHARALHDALDERFHVQGGIKYLYALFPGGPVAQGSRIAGLKAPATAVDQGFGSVM